MLLALDIGNSSITVGAVKLIDDGSHEIVYSFKISNKIYSSDEYAFLIGSFLEKRGISCSAYSDSSAENLIDSAVISSVVPALTDIVAKSALDLCGNPPFIINNGIRTGFGIKIRNPEQLGADIVSNVAAALHLTKPPFVILDMGTATTLTIVNASSDVLGSIIIPGLKVSMSALSESAALLSDVSLDKTEELIGRDTRSSISSGVINGNIIMIDGFIRNIRDELKIKSSDEKLGLIATGGLAGKIIPYTRNKFTFDETLTLSGTVYLYRKNMSK